jgi:signal transduction histidine kinase
MEHLIDDLLDMASIQAGRLSIEAELQEVVPIIQEAIQMAEPQARERGLKLSSEVSLESERCNVDRERLLQLGWARAIPASL